jgi:hypothetical protein
MKVRRKHREIVSSDLFGHQVKRYSMVQCGLSKKRSLIEKPTPLSNMASTSQQLKPPHSVDNLESISFTLHINLPAKARLTAVW